MNDFTTETMKTLRRRRRHLAVFWGLMLGLSLGLLYFQVGGLFIPGVVAMFCLFMVLINTILALTGQSSPSDMSDLSPNEQRRQHHAEDDDKPWKF